MKQTRNQHIEALRSLAMLSVILLHVSGRYLEVLDIHTSPGEYSLCLGFRQLFFSGGVSVYAFISGYYGIKLRFDKVLSMEMLAIFWGGLEIVLLMYQGQCSGWMIRCLLFPTAGGYFWYFACYMQLLLLSPLVNMGITNISKESLKYTVLIFVFYCYVLRFLCHGNDCDVFTLLSLYLIGRYLKLYPVDFCTIHALKCVVVLALINVIAVSLFSYVGLGKVSAMMAGNNYPITVMLAISLFFLFLSMKKRSVVIDGLAKMAPYTLGIYIVHSIILDLYSDNLKEQLFFWGGISILMYSVLLFLLSGVLEYMRQKLFA